jgi:dynein heavy chain
MVAIRNSCNTLAEQSRVFDTNIDKIIRLDEFKQLQSAARSTINYQTATKWVNNLIDIISNGFSKIGKGWFNIHETSKETYEFGKLKKFLTAVNFMMQDAVLTLTKDSVHEFVKFILKFIPEEDLIARELEGDKIKDGEEPEEVEEGEKEEESDFEDEEEKEEEERMPLFVLDLVLKPGQALPQYSTDPLEVVSRILEIFDEGVKQIQEIPQLEPQLLKTIFKTHGKTVKAPVRPPAKPPIPTKEDILPDENTWLWEYYECLKENIET